MSENFYREIVEVLAARVRLRVDQEIRPKLQAELDRIIADEAASVAISVSRWVEIKTLSDRLIIEVRRPEKKP